MTGLDGLLASVPIADAPRGGVDSGFNGVFGRNATGPAAVGQAPGASPPPALPGQSGSLAQGVPGTGGSVPLTGPLLEADDATTFRSIHNLVLRQERLKRNQLALDTHWTRIRQGFIWSRLTKLQDQDIWRAEAAPGTSDNAAVPNKAADLCNKIVETLMVDPPVPDPQALDLGETAERAVEMARQFLETDATDTQMSDNMAFWLALDASMTRASAYIHLWVDQTGGGYVPLQILAHPQAQDPNNPDIAMSPMGPLPAVDPILRYVATDEQGNLTQFVTDPADAGLQWLPKIRFDYLGREHVRIFPETEPIQTAETVILLWYTTLGAAKRRWPDTIGSLDEQTLGELCDWTPTRYIALLPPALRARWKLTTGAIADPPGTANDERIMFYYHYYRRPSPNTIGRYRGYPYGAEVVVSGAWGGYVIHKDTLSSIVTLPDKSPPPVPPPQPGAPPPPPQPPANLRTTRCMEIPLVQVTPRLDPDNRDPSGFCTISLFGGAGEASNTLLVAYLEALDIILHPAKFIPGTSPVQGWQIEASRGNGNPVPVLSRDDFPKYEDPRPLPPGLIDTVAWNYSQMESISGLTKPAMGANDQQEVSGIARNIAVRQAMVALSRAAQQTMNAWSRFWRLKLQLAVRHFQAPQLIHYVGEDGAFKEEWFKGNDFAVIDHVSIQAGTGSMMPPAEKQQSTAFAQQMRWISQDEAADVARPTFSDALGLGDSPHQMRIERQVSAWLKGVPYPTWPQEWDQYAQQQQAFTQAQQQYQMAVQQYNVALHNQAIASGGPPPMLGPEAQNAQAMQVYQSAVLALQLNPVPPAPPQSPQIPPPQMPWTPFAVSLPNDNEPEIAQIRKRRLSNLIASPRFLAQPKQWQQPVFNEYMTMRQASSIGAPSAAAAQQQQQGQGPQPFGAAVGATAFQPATTPQAQSPGPGVPQTPSPMQQQSPGRPMVTA